MKVYIVFESNYGEISWSAANATEIYGVFDTLEKANKCKQERIENGKEEGFVVDKEIKDIENQETIIMFYEEQENWNSYYEISVMEMEVE